MENLSDREAFIFALCLLGGVSAGVIFDVFKIIRKSFDGKAFFTNLCDALFWTTYSCFFIWWIFKINDGELRWFVFAGIALGAAIYFLIFSPFFVYIGVLLLGIVKKFICMVLKFIFFPVRFIIRRMHKAVIFVTAPLIKLNKKISVLKRFIRTKKRIKHFCAKKI